jgi:hypothetical protein
MRMRAGACGSCDVGRGPRVGRWAEHVLVVVEVRSRKVATCTVNVMDLALLHRAVGCWRRSARTEDGALQPARLSTEKSHSIPPVTKVKLPCGNRCLVPAPDVRDHPVDLCARVGVAIRPTTLARVKQLLRRQRLRDTERS